MADNFDTDDDLDLPEAAEDKPEPAPVLIEEVFMAYVPAKVRRKLLRESSGFALLLQVPDASWARLCGSTLSRSMKGPRYKTFLEAPRNSTLHHFDPSLVRLLSKGERLVVISHGPLAMVPATVRRAADEIITIDVPPVDAVRKAIRRITGRIVRGLKPADYAGLDLDLLVSCLRPEESPASIVRRLRQLSSEPQAASASVPTRPVAPDRGGADLVQPVARATRGSEGRRTGSGGARLCHPRRPAGDRQDAAAALRRLPAGTSSVPPSVAGSPSVTAPSAAWRGTLRHSSTACWQRSRPSASWMNWTADLTALESDAAAAAAEIDGLGAQLAARNEELTAATRDLEEQKRRVTELDAALVDERVHHAETQRVLVSARAEVAALRREQSHASVIDERIETLGALVADLSAMAPKRRGRPRASSRPGGD